MNFGALGKAILHAAIGGASTGAALVIGGGNMSAKAIGIGAAASAVTSVISLFAKKPEKKKATKKTK